MSTVPSVSSRAVPPFALERQKKIVMMLQRAQKNSTMIDTSTQTTFTMVVKTTHTQLAIQ